MSDANDAVAKALARTRQLAAAQLARKEELQAELATRRGQRTELEGDPRAEVQPVLAELDARIKSLTAELASVEATLASARKELGDLGRLGRDASVADARTVLASIADDDPILRSAEDEALANVRGHIQDLEARARVQSEIAKLETDDTKEVVSPPVSDDKPTKKTF